MQVYRRKKRSKEVVDLAHVIHGMTGWIEEREHVFDGPTKKWVTVEEFRALRRARATERARQFSLPHRRDRHSTFTH